MSAAGKLLKTYGNVKKALKSLWICLAVSAKHPLIISSMGNGKREPGPLKHRGLAFDRVPWSLLVCGQHGLWSYCTKNPCPEAASCGAVLLPGLLPHCGSDRIILMSSNLGQQVNDLHPIKHKRRLIHVLATLRCWALVLWKPHSIFIFSWARKPYICWENHW